MLGLKHGVTALLIVMFSGAGLFGCGAQSNSGEQAGGGSAGSKGQAGGQEKIVIAQAFQSLLYLPLYVALDKGYFEQEGLQVEKVTAGSGANGVSQVISGSATFSLQDPMTAVLSNLKGADLKSVAAVVNGAPVWIVARPDSGINTVEDLRGKQVATATAPSTSTYLLKRLLEEKKISNDLTVKEVQLGSELAPLLARQVDAAVVYEPQLEQGVIQGGVKIVHDFTMEYKGGYAFSAIDAKNSTIQERPEMVQKFVNGLEKALRSIHGNPDEAVKVAQKEFPSLPPDVVEAGVRRMIKANVYPEHVLITEDAFRTALDLQVYVGNIKPGQVKYEEQIDPSFARKTTP